jgi:hypothetical protein
MSAAVAVSSSSNQPSTLTSILGNALEVTLHEILYTRSLYPRDAFTATRYLGITCHACRHPGVVQYIHETLLVAVPALLSGAVDELILIFYDDLVDTPDTLTTTTRRVVQTQVLERYVFSFDVQSVIQANIVFQQDQDMYMESTMKRGTLHGGGGGDPDHRVSQTVAQRIQDLERCMRDVLLKIISMDGTDLGRKRGHTVFTDTSTFKLCLHKSTRFQQQQRAGGGGLGQPQTCETLQQVLDQGTWLCPDESSCEVSSTRVANIQPPEGILVRPLRSIQVPSCGLSMQLLMESQSSGS